LLRPCHARATPPGRSRPLQAASADAAPSLTPYGSAIRPVCKLGFNAMHTAVAPTVTPGTSASQERYRIPPAPPAPDGKSVGTGPATSCTCLPDLGRSGERLAPSGAVDRCDGARWLAPLLAVRPLTRHDLPSHTFEPGAATGRARDGSGAALRPPTSTSAKSPNSAGRAPEPSADDQAQPRHCYHSRCGPEPPHIDCVR